MILKVVAALVVYELFLKPKKPTTQTVDARVMRLEVASDAGARLREATR